MQAPYPRVRLHEISVDVLVLCTFLLDLAERCSCLESSLLREIHPLPLLLFHSLVDVVLIPVGLVERGARAAHPAKELVLQILVPSPPIMYAQHFTDEFDGAVAVEGALRVR